MKILRIVFLNKAIYNIKIANSILKQRTSNLVCFGAAYKETLEYNLSELSEKWHLFKYEFYKMLLKWN